MLDLALSSVSRLVVEDAASVTAGEQVVLVTEPTKVDVARSIATACTATGATTVMIVQPKVETHGNELPTTVAAAMKEADVMFDINTHAITHTTARREASDAGTRYVTLRGVTTEMMLSGAMDTDYEYTTRVRSAIAHIQSAADSVHVSSPEGTDITADIAGRAALPHSEIYEYPGFIGLPAGKSGLTPNEGTGQGTIVFDYSFDELGLLDEPLTMEFEDGEATSITGGKQADTLRRIVEDAGAGARNLAEMASLGTNPDIELTGNQATDKKKLGTVNFAIGDNVSLGGTVTSDIHLDGIILNGTVRFDDDVVVEDGTFLEETVFDLADEIRNDY